MTLPFSPYEEIASIIARFATADGDFPTAIDNLTLFRRSAPTQAQHAAYKPGFAIVAQGTKSLTVGREIYHYERGNIFSPHSICPLHHM